MLFFFTENQAIAWMCNYLGDPCIDNIRVAYKDDRASLKRYRRQKRKGCCGFFDQHIMIGLRKAKIGCNFGH